MKRGISTTFFFLFISFSSISQITKDNWMVGGNAMISFSNQTVNAASSKGQNISIAPNVGYFFVDKFVGGIRSMYTFSKVNSGPIVASSSSLYIGPFARHYFLDKDNRTNFFADAMFQFGKSFGSNSPSENQTHFVLSAGPVIYLNSSVGFEMAINYDIYKNKSGDAKANTLFFTLGFQIHLEKE